MPEETQALGPHVELDGRPVLTGSCSWADRTLTKDADFYPRKSMSAEDRLRFYAAQFPLTEIDATYYAPPAEQQARLWAQRTPQGFRFDVKAYSLLTGHPTRPQSLWSDLRERLPDEVLQKRNVYPNHLGPELVDEAWRRFAAALKPLHDAGRLGAILFQYPAWFVPRKDNRQQVEALRERLPDYLICVEFRSPMWLAEERDRNRTLSMLGDSGLALVSLDAPRASELPRFMAVTNPDLFVVRFHGRSDENWSKQTRTAAERFRYLYSRKELKELTRPVVEHVAEAKETHLLMNNCYRDYAVRNAAELRDLLANM
ncbi:MAG TPA: DUF72 domain-containing protein [Solirubrobacteraceae bacterium]